MTPFSVNCLRRLYRQNCRTKAPSHPLRRGIAARILCHRATLTLYLAKAKKTDRKMECPALAADEGRKTDRQMSKEAQSYVYAAKPAHGMTSAEGGRGWLTNSAGITSKRRVPSALARQHALNLLQRLALGLGHDELHEEQARQRQGHVHEEDARGRQQPLEHVLREVHEDVEAEVHHRRHRERGAPHAHREDLGDHEPSDGAEADLVAADVDHEGDDGGQGPLLRQLDLVRGAVLRADARRRALPEAEGGPE